MTYIILQTLFDMSSILHNVVCTLIDLSYKVHFSHHFMRSLSLPSSDTSCPSLLKCAQACLEHHRPCFDTGVGEWLLHQPNDVHAHLHVHDDLIVWREEAVVGFARGRGQIVEAPTRVLVNYHRQAAGL